MPTLGVNIDHVATVRQARRTDEPDPVWAAVEAQLGGASCITFHLREDRRHIIDRDVPLLKGVVNVKLNMEMAIAPDVVAIALETRPDQCCLVPEKREEVTTEGGLDVVKMRDKLKDVVSKLRDVGSICSAFVEPDPAQIEAAAAVGFEVVELWTGGYAHAATAETRMIELEKLDRGISFAEGCGLRVHGGHGLTYRNIGPVAGLTGFEEFNIGHSIMARAMFVGVRTATAEMVALLDQHGSKE